MGIVGGLPEDLQWTIRMLLPKPPSCALPGGDGHSCSAHSCLLGNVIASAHVAFMFAVRVSHEVDAAYSSVYEVQSRPML